MSSSLTTSTWYASMLSAAKDTVSSSLLVLRALLDPWPSCTTWVSIGVVAPPGHGPAMWKRYSACTDVAPDPLRSWGSKSSRTTDPSSCHEPDDCEVQVSWVFDPASSNASLLARDTVPLHSIASA